MEAFGFKEAVLGHYPPPPAFCWASPSADGGFAGRGVNLSSKQMKRDSAATADSKRGESELAFPRSIGTRGRAEGKIHFLLIAARADAHVVGSAIGCCVLGKVMRH